MWQQKNARVNELEPEATTQFGTSINVFPAAGNIGRTIYLKDDVPCFRGIGHIYTYTKNPPVVHIQFSPASQ